MDRLRPLLTALFLGILLGVIGCGGCSSGDPAPALKAAVLRANNTNGKRLATLYSRYHARFFSGPRDEAAFKKFIAGMPAAELEEIGGSSGDVDGLFVSERDKQPFFIRYGLKVNDSASRALVLETQGLSDKAVVVFGGRGGIKEVTVPIAELEGFRAGKRDNEGELQPTASPAGSGNSKAR